MADHKIAILFTTEMYDRYEDYSKVIDRVTDWEVVSEEDYQILCENRYKKGFEIVEIPINQTEFIQQTVASLLAEAKEEKEAKRKEKQRQADVARANRAKNEATARDNKLKQLAKLQKELGLVNADTKVSQ